MTDSEERKLPLLEHLRELQACLRNALLALLIGIGVCFFGAQDIFALLAKPLIDAWHQRGLGIAQINFGSLTEPFWVYFKVALYAGILVSSPVTFYQLWRFITPGLYQRERKIALPFAAFSALFFVVGAMFGYFVVLPEAFSFFLSYSSKNINRITSVMGFVENVSSNPLAIQPTLFMQQYLDLVSKMLLGFGLVFELPILVFFLSYVGLITHRSLWRFSRYAVVISFVVAAFLTPGPDVISQLLMAMPLVVLYYFSILVAWCVVKMRQQPDAPNT